MEALIPGARGRVLGALARVDRELTLRAIAELAETSPTQTSRVLTDLVHLGVVRRREVPPAALFWLVTGNVTARIVRELERVDDAVITQFRRAARRMRPQPFNMTLFGSFARREADSESDIDVLLVRPHEVDEDTWGAGVDSWTGEARVISGNPVRILEVGESELGDRLRVPRGIWSSIVEEGVHVIGTSLNDLGNTSAA